MATIAIRVLTYDTLDRQLTLHYLHPHTSGGETRPTTGQTWPRGNPPNRPT